MKSPIKSRTIRPGVAPTSTDTTMTQDETLECLHFSERQIRKQMPIPMSRFFEPANIAMDSLRIDTLTIGGTTMEVKTGSARSQVPISCPIPGKQYSSSTSDGHVYWPKLPQAPDIPQTTLTTARMASATSKTVLSFPGNTSLTLPCVPQEKIRSP